MRVTNHRISQSHPLRQLFNDLVRRRFIRDVHLSDPYVPGYVSGLLLDFTLVDSLYRIRNVRGKYLEGVGDVAGVQPTT